MNKKTFSIVLISVCVAFVCLIGFHFISNSNNSKQRELNVAFSNIPESTQDYLKTIVKENFTGKINFVSLEKNDFTAKELKKADLLFSWKGELTDKLSDSAKIIPDKALKSLPTSLRKKSEKQLPILLNPYVLDFYSPAREAANVEYPEYIDELESYLKKISGQVFTPFFCEGGNDDVLISLVGFMIHSKYGMDEFNNYIKDLQENKAIENKKVIEVLDTLKNWSKIGLLHPMWYLANQNDVVFFAENKNIGVLFTSLASHRAIKYNDVRDFEMYNFPYSQDVLKSAKFGIIGSEIVCLNLNKPLKCKDILINLVNEQNQENLSSLSMLGPSAMRGAAFDIQADDARFYTASCSEGILVAGPVENNAEKFRAYIKKIE